MAYQQSNQIHGIRISPDVVEFRDVNPEVVYQIPLAFQNLSANLKRIRIRGPLSKVGE